MSKYDAPLAVDIQTITHTLRDMTPEQQRRSCIAALVLCGLYREAQQAIDIAVVDSRVNEVTQ